MGLGHSGPRTSSTNPASNLATEIYHTAQSKQSRSGLRSATYSFWEGISVAVGFMADLFLYFARALIHHA